MLKHWAHSSMRMFIDTFGNEIRHHILLRDWMNAVVIMKRFAKMLRDIPERFSSFAFWVPVLVPPGGGCGSSSARLGSRALRWLRRERFARAAIVLDRYATLLERLAQTGHSTLSLILAPSQVPSRQLCFLWKRALG